MSYSFGLCIIPFFLLIMHKLETKHKIKFSRKLINKLNRSLSIIYNNIEPSHDSHDIINTDNDSIKNIANDNNTNNNAILQKSLCDISDYDDINIPCDNELINNVDHVNKLSCNIKQIDNRKNEVLLSSKVAKWAIQENITSSALKNLLSIIGEISGCKEIPKDPRILLRTPNNIVTTPVGSGTYYYFGIEKTLNLFCVNHNINVQPNEEFSIAINIDGLPLSKSSNSSFWPILCSVKSIKVLIKHVFLIALHHDSEKPTNEFFKDFVNECILLSTNGILINSFRYPFRIFMLICDSPAKSFALGIKNHTGYFSCTKCDQE